MNCKTRDYLCGDTKRSDSVDVSVIVLEIDFE
jgi:hypothetical protein